MTPEQLCIPPPPPTVSPAAPPPFSFVRKTAHRQPRPRLCAQDGNTTGWEEYFDYIFPQDGKPQALKILEMAQKWKKQKTDE